MQYTLPHTDAFEMYLPCVKYPHEPLSFSFPKVFGHYSSCGAMLGEWYGVAEMDNYTPAFVERKLSFSIWGHLLGG